jgi:pimeloyl-ACP methyl ester carboxylesterase
MSVRAILTFTLILVTSLQGCISDQSNVQASHSGFLKPAKHTDGVIVFIHGLFGDAESTWKNKTTGAFWPNLVSEDPAFAGDDIFLVGYGSPYVKTSSNIEEIAQRVLQQITDSRVLEYKKIYLITHSMGGLIAKRIITALNRPSTVDQLRRIRAIVYLSTPTQGAPLADIASWISMNPQLKDLSPSDFSTFLQSLENDWQQLLRERDRAHENYPLSFCAYETQPTGLFHVVSRLYSTTRCDNTSYAIDLDHVDIVKPSDINTDPYPWVRARIEEANHPNEPSRIEAKTPSPKTSSP